MVNTIFYLAKAGCPWAMLPSDLAKRSTANDDLTAWRANGTWQTILDTLRQQVRVAAGRDPNPSENNLGVAGGQRQGRHHHETRPERLIAAKRAGTTKAGAGIDLTRAVQLLDGLKSDSTPARSSFMSSRELSRMSPEATVN